MKPAAYIGVDPGYPLYMALVDNRGKLKTIPQPHHYASTDKNDPYLIANIFNKWMLQYRIAMLACETVFITKMEGAKSLTRYVGSYHTIEGIAAALNIPFTGVHPRTWKQSADKKLSLEKARQLWPQHAYMFAKVKDHNKAEAALIARWAYEHDKTRTSGME